MNEKAQQNKAKMQIIHSVIGIAIMIFFRYLPISLPEVTPVGMEVLGIFIGTLYLWTTVDPLWSSLMSIAMLGFSSYAPMPKVIQECFGNPVLMQCFFMMLMSGILVYYKVSAYIGRFFLTRKFCNGRPWVLTTVICIGSFLMAAFINPFTGIFLLWPVLYGVFDDLGYKKGDAFPRVLLTLVIVSALIGFPVPPYQSNGLALLGNFAGLTEKMTGTAIHVNNAAYMGVAVSLGLLMIAGCVLYSKFVIRPDVTKLKEFNVEILNKNPLPPMSGKQKVISVSFITLILCMLVPSLFPKLPGMAFLASNVTGLGMTITAILGAIIVSGERVADVTKVMEKNFNWSSYYIIAAAILLGGVLTSEATGISAFLKVVLSPIFNGLSPAVFTIVLLVTAMILTNLCNSLVIGMILQPVVVTYCMQTGVAPEPIVTLLITFVLLSAAITPAASPFAAILHSNKEWVPTKYVYQYTIPFVVIETIIVLVIGIPLANLLL